MVLFKRRNKFEKLSLKIGKYFSRLGLTPNQWTGLGLFFAIVTAVFLAMRKFFPASGFFLIAILVDFIDGSVARFTKKSSKWGAYLDTITDRYTEAIVLLGLLFVSLPWLILPTYMWIFLFFFGSLMTTYAKAAAKEKELVRKEVKGGILERAERVFLLFLGIFLAGFNPFYLTFILIILAVLANVTALQRIWIVKRLSKKRFFWRI